MIRMKGIFSSIVILNKLTKYFLISFNYLLKIKNKINYYKSIFHRWKQNQILFKYFIYLKYVQ